ncbi:SDR family oxidoreductase [Pelistega sp. NLN82]|uniref:SDR family oxidoreductase n=1 Tax=Pelistega ratti TaxID=2652177 RepID=A0A6L9Y3V5_9BURK|nr:SDR family oxidoreductase [Pelistega ratti]NEN75120.1 SDR family oxidoreductase [Pelistega ratti]
MNSHNTTLNIPYLSKFSLQNKIIFISASSRGLGLEMAYALAQSGATVYINGRNQEKLAQVVEEAQSKGISLLAYEGDMSDQYCIDQLMLFLKSMNQNCHVLINNLGLRLRESWEKTHFVQMNEMIQTNLLAPMYLSQQMAKQMQEGGRIISISSVAGRIARQGDAIYPISKLGLIGMTRSLAVEYATKGICVNAIAPGAFLTESNEALAVDPIKGSHMLNRIPMKRWGNPEEIGGLAVFLAGDLSAYITGQVFTIDGGLSVLF